MRSNHKQPVNNSKQEEVKQSFRYKLYTQLKKSGWITDCYVLVCHLLWYSTEKKVFAEEQMYAI